MHFNRTVLRFSRVPTLSSALMQYGLLETRRIDLRFLSFFLLCKCPYISTTFQDHLLIFVSYHSLIIMLKVIIQSNFQDSHWSGLCFSDIGHAILYVLAWFYCIEVYVDIIVSELYLNDIYVRVRFWAFRFWAFNTSVWMRLPIFLSKWLRACVPLIRRVLVVATLLVCHALEGKKQIFVLGYVCM